ncbi:alpha/beta hydrolase family protein [Arenibacterium sp. CAU 1754]
MLDMQMTSSRATKAITFPAGDAHLQGTLFLPSAAPRAALVLNGATGVPQGYYRAFAQWLAGQQNIACLTYDYSDFGLSARGHMRASRVTMADWALRDQPAARAALRAALPGVPLWVMGHSLGAMLMPLQEGIEDVERMIGVSSGMVHHHDHPWPYQALARLFWFGHVPLVVKMAGYLPGRISGFGVDLPASVYWQWRRWCISPAFCYGEFGATLPHPDWSRSGAPVDLIAFEDDQTSPPFSVSKLVGLYGVNRAKMRVLNHADFGLNSVGHMGAFARRNAALWPELIADHRS